MPQLDTAAPIPSFLAATSAADARAAIGAAADADLTVMDADVEVWNAVALNFLTAAAVPAWSIKTAFGLTELNITNLGAGGGLLRFLQTGGVQWNGLASLLSPKVATDLSATPDISRTSLLRLDNTGATTITAFTGGHVYQQLTVLAGNGNTTLQHSASLQLIGGRNRTLGTGEVVQFIMSSTGATAYQVGGEAAASSAIQTPGTTGAVTQNTSKGRVNFAAAATSLVVTNSLVAATSIITVSKATNDSTARLGAVVAGAGSFTIYMDVAPAAECAVNYSLAR